MNAAHALEQKLREKHEELYQLEANWVPALEYISFPDEWGFEVIGSIGFTWKPKMRISCPFNRAMYPILKDFMADHGWELKTSQLSETTDWYPYMTFEHSDIGFEIEFVFFDFSPKSVCKKRYLGVQKKEVEVPVYEFSCQEEL
jgi:hypothetical protein